MRIYAPLVLLAALAFAACGGGSGSSPISAVPNTGGGGTTAQAQSETAISTENALGSPLKDFTSYEHSISISASSRSRVAQSLTLGTCMSGTEFFSPDKNGDQNSTERQYFYDSSCTQLARDIVRIYQQTSSTSATVARTTKLYAPNNAAPIATRSDNDSITNASFDKYGDPIPANGFNRVNAGYLDISGSRTINGDSEFVMLASNSGVSQFCQDSAGFNATGLGSLKETFGWQGGALSTGTRTVNADGSVTYSATHTGSTFKGAIGSLSVNTGTQNTACPVTTPMFTLAGGSQTGTYSIPIGATYLHGVLTNLTITNASLANGTTLNVQTNQGVPPSSNLFISGTIAQGTAQVATFSVDAFGDGTLTVTSSGAQYVITDWHVVK
ncbi:MAG: hypothetical protein ACXWNJ_02205 [Vulcanimicrobiaceae bacterium]